ncbi:MAG: CRISPR-associated endonuclease Cas2 [bacterium]
MMFGGRFRLPQEVDEWERGRLYWQRYRKEKRAILALKRRKLLEIHHDAGSIQLVLSKEGRSLALQYKIFTCQDIMPANLWCYVLFDIPEEARSVRQLFRNFLKKAGFSKVQLSVWKTNKAIADHLSELVNLSELKKWVTILRSQ